MHGCSDVFCKPVNLTVKVMMISRRCMVRAIKQLLRCLLKAGRRTREFQVSGSRFQAREYMTSQLKGLLSVKTNQETR